MMRGSLVPAVLRYVDQVAKSGSIQRAAKELNIAASAVNRQILLLEQELGVTLFERVTRGMRLTSRGRYRGDPGAALAVRRAARGSGPEATAGRQPGPYPPGGDGQPCQRLPAARHRDPHQRASADFAGDPDRLDR